MRSLCGRELSFSIAIAGWQALHDAGALIILFKAIDRGIIARVRYVAYRQSAIDKCVCLQR
jgi:hypothetical protein